MSKNNNKKIAIGAGILLGLGTLGFFGYHTAKQTQLLQNQNQLTMQQTTQDKELADSANTTSNSINESVASIDSVLNAVADSNAFRVYETPSIFNVYDSITATITDHNGYVRDSITNQDQINYILENTNLNGYVNDARDTAVIADDNSSSQTQTWNSNYSNNSHSTIPVSVTGDYVYLTSPCAGCLEEEINGATYYVDTSSIEGKREAYALGLLNTNYESVTPWSQVGSFTPTLSELEMGAEMRKNQDN